MARTILRKFSACFFHIKIKEPIAKANVAPHDAFASLLLPAADNGWDSVADAHDGTVHFMTEETRAADVSGERLICEPEFITPNNAFAHVLRQLVVKHLL